MPKNVVASAPLAIVMDRTSRVPIVEQLANGVRQAVHGGRLQAGDRLPSSRELARQLRVARGTVAVAYEQLVSEGCLESRVGSGTRVRPGLVLERPHPKAAPVSAPIRRQSGSRLCAEFERSKDLLAVRLQAPFAVFCPSAELAPRPSWHSLSTRIAHATRSSAAHYHAAQGHQALREALAAYLHRSRGVLCEPEQVLITSGAQQALNLTVKVLLDPGDRAAVESPGYRPLHHLLRCARVRMVPLQVDDEGAAIAPERLLKLAVKALFLTPSHQYPLGMVLSMKRRMAALEWASRSGGWVVEDDYDSEFYYGGRPFPALQGMDAGERIIYIGSLSKALSPAIRIGYAVVPKDYIGAFAGAKLLDDFHSPILQQAVLAEFIAGGSLEAHVRRVRQVLQTRHAALKAALAAEAAGDLRVMPWSDQGLFVTALLERGDDVELAAQAARDGIELRPLSPHYVGVSRRSGFILGFAAFEPAQIHDSMRRLVRLLRRGRAGRAGSAG